MNFCLFTVGNLAWKNDGNWVALRFSYLSSKPGQDRLTKGYSPSTEQKFTASWVLLTVIYLQVRCPHSVLEHADEPFSISSRLKHSFGLSIGSKAQAPANLKIGLILNYSYKVPDWCSIHIQNEEIFFYTVYLITMMRSVESEVAWDGTSRQPRSVTHYRVNH